MMRIEFAHLYVEKYSRHSRELILDFIQEAEFIFFRNHGDYLPEMHLSTERFEPTMLLIHDCVPARRIKEGTMLIVSMDALMRLSHAAWRANNDYKESIQYQSGMVYEEIYNGADFAALIDSDKTVITNSIPENLYYHLTPTWGGSPCALDALQGNYELRIWDVGQGSTNSVSDQENLTLFDFGASIHYSKLRRGTIVNQHASLFADKKRISLIISHWDCDHINLLCEVDNCFLENICCVFYPPGIVSMTAKQIAARMAIYCRYRVEVLPKPRRIRHKCGIQRVDSGKGYILYTGEKSESPNQSGLLLTLSSTNSAALLTADHTNYQVWDVAFNDARVHNKRLHIVVPHHGGYCGRTAVQSVANPGKAVISTGSNPYGHPLQTTLTAYRCAGYAILQTDIIGDDIVIPMR